MSNKDDNEIKKAVALAKKKQQEFFQEESDKEKNEFLQAYRKEYKLDNETPIKSSSTRIKIKSVIVCSDSEDETPIKPVIIPVIIPDIIPDIIPVIIPVFELASHREVINKPFNKPVIIPDKPIEVKSIFQERREDYKESTEEKPKLISVKQAPYDLKQSNNDKVKLVEMQEKYNALMKKYNARGEEVKQLKKENEKSKKYINKLKPTTTMEKLTTFINDNYEITTNRKDKIKCNEIYKIFFEIDQSFSQQAFNKSMLLLNITKCQKEGYNHFNCIIAKEKDTREEEEDLEGL